MVLGHGQVLRERPPRARHAGAPRLRRPSGGRACGRRPVARSHSLALGRQQRAGSARPTVHGLAARRPVGPVGPSRRHGASLEVHQRPARRHLRADLVPRRP
eukprot:330008-Alexandrium_andersonii.AAC.1